MVAAGRRERGSGGIQPSGYRSSMIRYYRLLEQLTTTRKVYPTIVILVPLHQTECQEYKPGPRTTDGGGRGATGDVLGSRGRDALRVLASHLMRWHA